MAEETTKTHVAEAARAPAAAGRDDERSEAAEEFSAAAPPHPGAKGTGETSFGDAEAPPAGEHQVQADLDAAEKKAQEYLALAQRTQADFENYRKRMARENANAVDRGVAKLAKELLPALDHLDIALKAASPQTTSSSDPESGHEDVVKGFAIVRDEFVSALGKAGIQAFSPEGEPFDPNEHEAMAQQPAEGKESGTVIEVYQSGYRLNGSVLRPARVVVAQ